MFKHEWFDLYLHTDEELGNLLNSPIARRETLHEWPLSCVQSITTEDNQRWIYKTQSAPSVESRFYAAAKSDLLITARTLYEQGQDCILLLEYIDAPLLGQLKLTADEVLRIGRKIQGQMAPIEGDYPVLFDVSSPQKWRDMVQQTVDNLRSLVEKESFSQVTPSAIDALKQHVLSTSVLDATSKNVGLVHGDFTGDNLFALPDDKFKVIDWSRPFRGTTAIDLVSLLESTGHDTSEHVDDTILYMHHMLKIKWLTDCATRWFTPGVATYDQQIADLINRVTSI